MDVLRNNQDYRLPSQTFLLIHATIELAHVFDIDFDHEQIYRIESGNIEIVFGLLSTLLISDKSNIRIFYNSFCQNNLRQRNLDFRWDSTDVE